MKEAEWDLEKVKRLKRRLNIELNLVYLCGLLLFILYALNYAHGSLVLAIILCLMFGSVAAISWYKLKTGKAFGNETARYLDAFEQDRLGKHKWREKRKLEAIIFTVISLIFVLCLFIINWSAFEINSYHDILPLAGAWVGVTIGQFINSRFIEGD